MEKNLKKAYYVIIGILILLFFNKEEEGFYKNIKIIENPDDILVLVNKNNQLLNSYIPNNLESISLKYANKDKYLQREAKMAFETLSEDTSKLGYRIVAVSAFRLIVIIIIKMNYLTTILKKKA